MGTPDRADQIAAYIRSHWKYNPETGVVHGRLGKPIGFRRKDSALHAPVTLFDGSKTSVLIHRAAWLLETGAWPSNDIDHRDGDRSNNRWSNLREATRQENRQNLSRRNKKGRLRGCVKYYKKWKAQIKMPGGAPMYLGLFATEEEAHAAYCEAKKRLHPFQPVQRE